MLSREENELLCRVGPGTPMGKLMRQYWTPALLSSELAGPDCRPVRVMLLGEELIAFRDTGGRVGLIGNHCLHRGASLFFGRNEEHGLRCVYHGWKYDVAGACVDMPNEPVEANLPVGPGETGGHAGPPLQRKIRVTAYPCRERGGIVWAYMGPRDAPPPLPDLEPNMLREGEWRVSAAMSECNYFQALEGDMDTCHSPFLHSGTDRLEDTRPGTFQHYRVQDRSPRYRVQDTDFGTMYGACIPAGDAHEYWRIAYYLFPFYAIIPSGVLGHQVLVQAWVPMDDTHTMFFSMGKREGGSDRFRGTGPGGVDIRGKWLEPNTTDWHGRFRLRPDLQNDYLIDREKQRLRQSFTGIDGVPIQDKAMTESMGPIFDRRIEHLGSSDAMIIRTRRRLLGAAQALQKGGIVPPGVDDPEVYRVRGGGVILSRGVDWLEATKDLRRAFVDHPDLDPAVTGYSQRTT